MGIRFRCHHCEHELHVKDFQGGKRGKCPACSGRFRIPLADAEHSLDVDANIAKVQVSADAFQGSPNSHRSGSASPQDHDLRHDSKSTPARPNPEESENASLKPAAAQSRKRAPKVPESSAIAPKTSSIKDSPRQDILSEEEPASQHHVEEVQQPGEETPLEETSTTPQTATWYVRPPSGGQFGPATQEVFEQWLAESRVTPDSLVWCEGWTEWQVASQALAEHFVPGDASSAIAVKNLAPQSSELQEPKEQSYASDNPAAPGSVERQPSLGERNRLERRRKRKRNYTIMLAVLSVLAVVLVVALIVALVLQQ